MSELLPALAGALVVAGLLGVIVGLQRVPRRPPAPPRAAPVTARLRMSPRTRLLLLVGLGAGLLIAALTGWVLGVVLVPAALVGLPILLTAPPAGVQIRKLEALEEWIRGLAGVLTAGVGLEQALNVSLRSTPEAIRPEVATLVARLRARWRTEDALRAFADDIDDATGDLVASNLILGARRRGSGLAAVLEALSETVAADVRSRRAIEADRAKPRAGARQVTIILILALTGFALFTPYFDPLFTPVGQVVAAGLLSSYVVILTWMRRMTTGEPLPRFLGVSARRGVAA